MSVSVETEGRPGHADKRKSRSGSGSGESESALECADGRLRSSKGQAILGPGVDQLTSRGGPQQIDDRQAAVLLTRLKELGLVQADEILVGKFEAEREGIAGQLALREIDRGDVSTRWITQVVD